MSDNRHHTDEQWEALVQATARDFSYPPTPSLASRWRARPVRRFFPIWRLAVAAIIALLVVALVVPDVRAAVLRVLRIGAVEIIFTEPTATPTAAQPQPTPTETPGWLSSALKLSGETTLAEARAQVDFPIQLPVTLNEPNRVFLQRFGGPVVTLVWLKPETSDEIELVLQIFDARTAASKTVPFTDERPTTVNGRRAYWFEQTHSVIFFNRDGNFERLVRANVLVWEINRITYRLETLQDLATARHLAESIE